MSLIGALLSILWLVVAATLGEFVGGVLSLLAFWTVLTILEWIER